MEFEWDLSKEMANVRKHGVTFSEAVESFLIHADSSLWISSIHGKRGVSTGLENRSRPGFDDPFYTPGKENPDYWLGGVAKIQEALS